MSKQSDKPEGKRILSWTASIVSQRIISTSVNGPDLSPLSPYSPSSSEDIIFSHKLSDKELSEQFIELIKEEGKPERSAVNNISLEMSDSESSYNDGQDDAIFLMDEELPHQDDSQPEDKFQKFITSKSSNSGVARG